VRRVDERARNRHRLAAARVGHLATVRSNGEPHVVPCCFALLAGDVVVTAVDDVKAKSTNALRRLDNVRHQPHASLLIDHYDDDWSQLWWVRVDGAAEVVDVGAALHAEAIAALVAKYEQYAERPPPGPVLAIVIGRWAGWTA